MNLQDYYSEKERYIQFSREQASNFAKKIAGDFNPLHDTDSKRFCVPGDLLFACCLCKHGLSKKMHFRFSGMIGSGVELDFNPSDHSEIPVVNNDGKEFLRLTRSTDITRDEQLINSLIRQYVAFSGFSFPDLLVPLMAKHNVMINPQRPLVIYESMQIDLSSLDFKNVTLQQSGAKLKIKEKRGDALLEFRLIADDRIVGNGFKTMVLSGLRPYNEEAMTALVENYLTLKSGLNT